MQYWNFILSRAPDTFLLDHRIISPSPVEHFRQFQHLHDPNIILKSLSSLSLFISLEDLDAKQRVSEHFIELWNELLGKERIIMQTRVEARLSDYFVSESRWSSQNAEDEIDFYGSALQIIFPFQFSLLSFVSALARWPFFRLCVDFVRSRECILSVWKRWGKGTKKERSSSRSDLWEYKHKNTYWLFFYSSIYILTLNEGIPSSFLSFLLSLPLLNNKMKCGRCGGRECWICQQKEREWKIETCGRCTIATPHTRQFLTGNYLSKTARQTSCENLINSNFHLNLCTFLFVFNVVTGSKIAQSHSMEMWKICERGWCDDSNPYNVRSQ